MFSIKLMIDKTTEKSKAVKNPLTANPLITVEARRIRRALITNVNNPSVRRFIGRVRRIRIGFKVTLITPRNSASHRAAQKPLTVTPSIR